MRARSHHDQPDPTLVQGKGSALRLAIFLSGIALVVQLLGFRLTGSLALVGDTAHLFTDLLSLVISYLALRLTLVPHSHIRSFGHFRLEVLATFVNGLLLFLVGFGLIWEAIQRVQNPTTILALPLVGISLVGLLVNLLCAWLLSRSLREDHHHHGHDHHAHGHHAHDHHGVTDRNLQGALLHVLSDALGSVVVILGALVTHFTHWMWLDPLLAIFLSFLILRWATKLVWDSGHVLLEGAPRHLQMQEVLSALEKSDQRVVSVDDLHIWEITSGMYAATAEVRVSPMEFGEVNSLRENLQKILQEKFRISHSVLSMKL